MTSQKNQTKWTELSRRILSVALIAITAFTTINCDDDNENTTPPATINIVELAQATPSLSTLVAVLTKYPDLVTLLSGTTNYTVFAPTNDAFAGFLTAIGQTSADNIPESVLKSVLQYHVVAGSVRSTDLTTGNVTSALGEAIAVNVSSGVVLNESATVTAANVEATNGIVHIIDEVLVPPTILPIVGTIVAPAYFNKDFSTLTAAVVQAGLLTTLLSNDNQLTLFAPTNEAFAAAGITALPPNTTEGNATLTAILTYHVIAGDTEIKAEDIATGSSSASTLGGNIYLSKGAAGVFINGNSKVTAANVQASNGIVHVIDRTLVPASGNIATVATEKGFTQLVAAVAKFPDLLSAVQSDESNLTIFAPTDAAFQALYAAQSVANLDALVTKLGSANVKKVLQHHIVSGRVFSSDLVSGFVPTLVDQNVNVNVTALTITDASASSPASGLVATSLNVQATNGVIHPIDKVLIPNL